MEKYRNGIMPTGQTLPSVCLWNQVDVFYSKSDPIYSGRNNQGKNRGMDLADNKRQEIQIYLWEGRIDKSKRWLCELRESRITHHYRYSEVGKLKFERRFYFSNYSPFLAIRM